MENKEHMELSAKIGQVIEQCFLCSRSNFDGELFHKCTKVHLENYEKYIQKHEIYKHIITVPSTDYFSEEGYIFTTCQTCFKGVEELLIVNNQVEELESQIGYIVSSLTNEILQNRNKYSEQLPHSSSEKKPEMVLSDIADIFDIKVETLDDFHCPSPFSPDSPEFPLEMDMVSPDMEQYFRNDPQPETTKHFTVKRTTRSRKRVSDPEDLFTKISKREIRIVLEKMKWPIDLSKPIRPRRTTKLKAWTLKSQLDDDYSYWNSDNTSDSNDSHSSVKYFSKSRRKNTRQSVRKPTASRKPSDRRKLHACEICKSSVEPMSFSKFSKHILSHPKYKPFKCKFDNCEMKFRWIYALHTHEKKHVEKENKYHCEICGNNYRGPYELRKHKQRVHVNGNHVCKICGNKYKLKQNLMVHVKRFHGISHVEYADKNSVTKFRCKICDQCYSTKNMLKSHNVRFHTESVEFFCKFCKVNVTPVRSLTYINAGNKKLHTIGDIIKCTRKNCRERFNCTKMYHDHKEMHRSQFKKKCKEKSKIKSRISAKLKKEVTRNFDSESISSKSIPSDLVTEDENKDNETQNGDDKIPKTNDEASKIDNEIAEFDDGPPEIESEGEDNKIRRRKTRQTVNSNVNKSQSTDPDPDASEKLTDEDDESESSDNDFGTRKRKRRKTPCKTCGKVFSNKANWKRHIAMHKVGRKGLGRPKYSSQGYPCDKCGKLCKFPSSLIKHYKIHLKAPREPKPIVKDRECAACRKCGKIVLSRHLKKHMTIHDENKMSLEEKLKLSTYKCPTCEKPFTSKKNMSRHIQLVHSEDRPHKCTHPGCSRQYKDYISLRNHLQSHAEQTSYTCDICGKSFFRRDYGMLHYRRNHVESSKQYLGLKKKGITKGSQNDGPNPSLVGFKDPSQESFKNLSLDISENPSRDISNNVLLDLSKNQSQIINEVLYFSNPSLNIFTNPLLEVSKEHSNEFPNEPSHEFSKDSSQPSLEGFGPV